MLTVKRERKPLHSQEFLKNDKKTLQPKTTPPPPPQQTNKETKTHTQKNPKPKKTANNNKKIQHLPRKRKSYGWGREGKCKGSRSVLQTLFFHISRASEEGELSVSLPCKLSIVLLIPPPSPSPLPSLQGLYFPVTVCIVPQCPQPILSHISCPCPTPICLFLTQCFVFTYLWGATKGRSLKGQELFPHGSLLVLCGHAGPYG